MRLKHHRFRFGLIGNLKVLLCRIFGHRVSDDPTGFACQRCRLAYEEIYSPGYWKAMIEWMKPKPENVETKEIVSALVDELMKHTWFPSTEHQVDLFEIAEENFWQDEQFLTCAKCGHRILIDEAGLSPAHQGDTCPSCGAPDEEAFGGG